MPELGPYGSVRGARGNSRPYRKRFANVSDTPRQVVVRTCSKRAARRINPKGLSNGCWMKFQWQFSLIGRVRLRSQRKD